MPTAVSKSAKPQAVTAPNIQAIKVRLVGTSPLMMARFSQKAMRMMSDKITGVTKAGAKRVRETRDFEDDAEQATHYMMYNGKKVVGMPCAALRSACVSACKLTGMTMTRAKISIWVEAEGYDIVDNVPLTRLFGKSHMVVTPVTNANGSADLRSRPVWNEWYFEPTVRFDADQFTAIDVVNLLQRAGMQIGLLEGRMDSRNSVGIGYGSFAYHDLTEPKPF